MKKVLISLAMAGSLVLAGCGGPQPEAVPNTGGGTAKGRLQTDSGQDGPGAGRPAEKATEQTENSG